jgi:hypothetical protein
VGFGASPVDGAVPRPRSLALCEAKRKPKAPPRSLRGAGEVPRANRPPERPATPGPGRLWQGRRCGPGQLAATRPEDRLVVGVASRE